MNIIPTTTTTTISRTTSATSLAGRVIAAFAALAFLLLATGCYASMSYRGSATSHSVTERRTTTTYHSDGHTTTTVTTTTRGWVYYPEIHAYYNPNVGVYYYYYDGNWMKARTLPRSLRVHVGSGIRIDYVGARPYVNFHIHASNYRPRRSVSIAPRYVPPRSYPRGGLHQRVPGHGSKDERHRR